MTDVKKFESLDGGKGLNRKVFMNLNYFKGLAGWFTGGFGYAVWEYK
jgi:nitrate reductase NapE component